MKDPNQSIKDDINCAIRDLFADKDKFHTIDLDVVTQTVIGYVFSNIQPEEINDANRFECYYQLLGKSVALVQGWKINGGDAIQLPSETQASLVTYIEKTYGVNLN